MGNSGEPPIVAEDRLSGLPDDLLHTVMSFLTARQAVQTCVLSRRWEDLWRSMPCLDIDESEFHASAAGLETDSDSEYAIDSDCEEEGFTRFENFVTNLLMFHRAPTLNRFCFRDVHHHETKFVELWMRRGIKCSSKVMEIEFHFHPTNYRYTLPHLGSCSSRLSRLHLGRIDLGKTFTQQLRSGCPVLDDLELKCCTLHDTEIASCTLKKLTIVDSICWYSDTLTIKAPSLPYLKLVVTAAGWTWNGVVVNEMSSLVKATICLKGSQGHILPKIPCKLLCSLINVSDVTLSGFQTLVMLHAGLDTFPVFHNLRTLMFDECDLSDNFEILRCFLDNAPILEKRTLQYCKLPEGTRKRKKQGRTQRISLECQDTLTFQCPNLKWTVINYKEDDVDQLLAFCSAFGGIYRRLPLCLTKLEAKH